MKQDGISKLIQSKVWHREALGLSCHLIAENLNIDKSTVHRIARLLQVTSNISKVSYPLNSNLAYKLSKPA